MEMEQGFAKRLDFARRRAGFQSWLEFQKALPKGVKGTSYASVHSYKEGKTPPDEFIEAAAVVLGVSTELLRSDKVIQPYLLEAELDHHKEVRVRLRGLTLEVLQRHVGTMPGPVWGVFYSLVEDLYQRTGPKGFLADWDGVWRSHESVGEYAPDVLITVGDVERLLNHLIATLGSVPSGSYGEIVSAWLQAFALYYSREFGSERWEALP